MTNLVRACSAVLIVTLSLSLARATGGLDNTNKHVHAMFEKADVVFLGEYHSMRNHKQVFQAIMTSLVEAGTIDTIAVEFIQFADNDLLAEYLDDDLAVSGSALEKQYFVKFSNCNRRCGRYAKSGSWPILDKSYSSVLREIRRLKRAHREKIQFCGVNTDQFYKNQFYEIGSDVAGIKLLNPSLKKMGRELFGTTLIADRQNDYGWGSGALRELRFAENVSSCLMNSKKALVFTGGFHSMRLSKVSNPTETQVKWASVADIYQRMSGRNVFGGTIATSSDRAMKDSNGGLYGRLFQLKYQFQDFEFRRASDLGTEMKKAAEENAFSSLATYDFVIFGPNSEVADNNYDLPKKTI